MYIAGLFRGIALFTLSAGVLGCSGGEVVDGAEPEVAAPDAVRRANLHYDSYAALAARGGYSVSSTVVSTTALDPTSRTLEDEIIADINAADSVVPFIAGLGEGSDWWLQTELVAAANVLATGEDLEQHSRVLGRSVGLEYEEIYAMEMELLVGDEFVQYTAYAFHDHDDDAVEIIDPVVLGVGTVPEYVPRHSTVGESKNDTWLGCEKKHEQAMPQGEMEHWDWWCWDKASCADEAVGKIFCDTAKDGCPRIHGTTVQSGTCKNTAGGGLLCTGPGASSVNSKETTVPNGSCQDNINVELWWGPTSTITWEIEAKIGKVGVKFGGTTPSHSVYQVYKLTMCCVAPSDTEPPDTSSGGDDGGDSDDGEDVYDGGDPTDPAPVD